MVARLFVRVFLLIALTQVLSGCLTKSVVVGAGSRVLEVVGVHDSVFVEYCMIVARDSTDRELILLSRRGCADSVELFRGSGELLRSGNKYTLTISVLNLPVVAHRISNSRIQGEQPQYFTLSDSTLENMTWVWDHDTIRVPVFSSPDVYDRYYHRK